MNKTILYFLILLLTVCSSAIPQKATAANAAAGGELVYEWISDSTYRFYFKYFRDCSGDPEPTTMPLCMNNTCTGLTTTTTMTKWSPNPQNPVTTCIKNKCDSPASTLSGYKEWWYSVIVTLPARCSNWRFYTYVGTRNSSDNLLNPNASYLYIEATFNNTGSYQGNSSPYLSVRGLPTSCLNQPFTYNNGAADPNADSLATDIIMPRTGITACSGIPANMSFASASPPYSTTNNPFQTSNSFSLNTTTGTLSFTPTALGLGTFVTRVREYRNGVLIGSIMRENQLQTVSCTTIGSAPTSALGCFSGGANVGGTINGCINQPLSFCFWVKSSNPSAIYILSDNHSFTIPAANIQYFNQKKDSVRIVFNWTPTTNDSGIKNLIVTIKDSTCNAAGVIMYYTNTIPIRIWPKTRGLGDTTICPNSSVFLSAVNGSNFVWSVLPGGTPNSLSCTNCTSPIATPAITTRYQVVSTGTSYCPNINKDTVTVTTGQSPFFHPWVSITATPNPVTPGNFVTFTATPHACNNPSYLWYLNGYPVGATSQSFALFTPKYADSVNCRMTCNDGTCVKDTFSNKVYIIVNNTGVQNVAEATGINLYPNPNDGNFSLHYTNSKDVVTGVDLYNALGQLVHSQQFETVKGKDVYTIHAGNLPGGVYMLNLHTTNGMKTVKFMVQH